MSTLDILEAERRSRSLFRSAQRLWGEIHPGMASMEVETLLQCWLKTPIAQGPDEGGAPSPARTLRTSLAVGDQLERSVPPEQPAKPSNWAAATSPFSSAGPRMRFSEAAAEALNELRRTEGMSALRRNEYQWAVAAFRQWLEADPYVDEITPLLAGRYKIALTYYPISASKRPQYRRLTFSERVRAAHAAGETRLLNLITINSKYLLLLRRIYEWRRSSGFQPAANPFADIYAGRSRSLKLETRRRPFSDGEVCAPLSSPLFTGARGSRSAWPTGAIGRP